MSPPPTVPDSRLSRLVLNSMSFAARSCLTLSIHILAYLCVCYYVYIYVWMDVYVHFAVNNSFEASSSYSYYHSGLHTTACYNFIRWNLSLILLVLTVKLMSDCRRNSSVHQCYDDDEMSVRRPSLFMQDINCSRNGEFIGRLWCIVASFEA